MGTLSTLKSTAIGLSCAVAISPPVATSVIMMYMTQNCDVAAIWNEVNSTALCRFFTSSPRGAFFHACGSHPAGGALRNSAQTTTTAPCTTPQ